MGSTTGIEWADATVNWWIGCTKVSPACDHCYAEAWADRFGVVKWGARQPRRSRFRNAMLEAFKLHRKAQALGRPLTVFSNSLSDIFDTEVPNEWRDYVFARILLMPRLRWLVLTKRAAVMQAYLEALHSGARDLVATLEPELRTRAESLIVAGIAAPFIPQLWCGVTVENQAMAQVRIPALLKTRAGGRFLSMEPLLEAVDLEHLALAHRCQRCDCKDHAPTFNALDATVFCEGCCEGAEATNDARLDWVIAGGESGRGARPTHPDWVRLLRDQCRAAEVPFFFKQWGQWRPGIHAREGKEGAFAYYIPQRRPGTEWAFPGQVLDEHTASHATACMTRVQMKAQAGALLDGERVQQLPDFGPPIFEVPPIEPPPMTLPAGPTTLL